MHFLNFKLTFKEEMNGGIVLFSVIIVELFIKQKFLGILNSKYFPTLFSKSIEDVVYILVIEGK